MDYEIERTQYGMLRSTNDGRWLDMNSISHSREKTQKLADLADIQCGQWFAQHNPQAEIIMLSEELSTLTEGRNYEEI